MIRLCPASLRDWTESHLVDLMRWGIDRLLADTEPNDLSAEEDS